MTVAKLAELAVVLGESRPCDKTTTTSGGKIKVGKQKVQNSSLETGPCFDAYLETLMYGYVLRSMTSVLTRRLKPPREV